MFVDSLRGAGIGADELTCDHCGRVHMCPDYDPGMDWYNDEPLEDSQAAHRTYCEEVHKNNPSGVILHYDCDSVLGRYLDNVLFVIDCPCNGLYRYENFIWQNKDTIRTYLKSRIDQEYQWAQEELVKNKLSGIA